MAYSDLYFKSRSRTSPFLIVFAILSIVGFAFLFLRVDSIVPTRAAKVPLKQHFIVNVGSNQAGVFWQTETKQQSWIIFGSSSDKLDRLATDERDLESKKNSYINHYALLRNLEQDTTYYYKIVTTDGVVEQNDGSAFSLKTILPPATNSALKPAYGKVVTAGGDTADEAFVFVIYKNAYPLLTLTKVTGEFLVPLQYVVDKKTSKIINLTENDEVEMDIIDESQANTNIEAIIKKIAPVPQTIVLGKNYTFLQQDDVLGASVANTAIAPTTMPTPSVSLQPATINIIYPKEKSIIPGLKPLIKGLAVPQHNVSIELNTKPMAKYTVSANQKGEWNLNTGGSLKPGDYVLTVTTADTTNKQITLKRTFTVASVGNQVLGVSTQSAALSPTPTPMLVQPTITQTPTISLPTPTPIPVTTIPTVTPPVTGDNTMPFIVGSLALVALGVGLIFVF